MEGHILSLEWDSTLLIEAERLYGAITECLRSWCKRTWSQWALPSIVVYGSVGKDLTSGPRGSTTYTYRVLVFFSRDPGWEVPVYRCFYNIRRRQLLPFNVSGVEVEHVVKWRTSLFNCLQDESSFGNLLEVGNWLHKHWKWTGYDIIQRLRVDGSKCVGRWGRRQIGQWDNV